MSNVLFVETQDRREGVRESLKTLAANSVENKNVLIKPNFNTADPAPGSTHNDTLAAIVDGLWEMGAKSVTLGERSYEVTRRVMEKKGVLRMLKEKNVEIIDFDELDDKDWIEFKPENSHWPDGFRIARPILDAEFLLSTCCLKTHQFGGVFTLSLKLHVGAVPTSRNGYPYMRQLHQSFYQQEMIAEINKPFSPGLVILDGVDAFVDGGPAMGTRAAGNVFLASADRIAIDAVATAVLKHLGCKDEIMKKKIFDNAQIARAVQLGLGVGSPHEIELSAANEKSVAYRDKVNEILMAG